MNCYYSNLIEGHDTHPVELERALKNDYSQDQKKRDLQIEAKAHIEVQEWMDGGGLKREKAVTSEGIRETTAGFTSRYPKTFFGSKSQSARNACASYRDSFASAMCEWATMWLLVPERCHDFFPVLSRFTQGWGKPSRSFSMRQPTIACCGCILFLTEMDGSRA